MRRIEFEIIDHGCDGDQYFPGCGVSFTRFTDCTTGIGTSARDAATDALGYMDAATSKEDEDALRAAVESMSDAPSFDPEDEDISPEWHHYVSIRWAVVAL